MTYSKKISPKESHPEREAEIRAQFRRNHLLVWVDDYILTPKGDEMDWADHRYLIDIYEDKAQKMVLKKAAQIGVTTFGMNKAMWFADTNDVAIIYTFPTASDVADFSKARIAPIVQASDYLSRTVQGGIELKQLDKSFIYFRGAWSERQAISVDSDFNIHDEVDFSKPDIIDMYYERMSHSKYALSLTFSTPTIPAWGIDYIFNRSDKKEWFVRCPKCKKAQILKYPDSIKGDTKEARYACLSPKCLSTITDNARREGFWKATGDKGWKVSGYHISQLMAPWISATDVLQKEERARLRPTKQLSGIKDFYNFVLGEAYGGENQPLNRDTLLACIQNKHDLEKSHERTIMGIDQGDELSIAIYTKEKSGEIRLIHTEVTEKWDRLPDLMDDFGVVFCMIDALPNKASAKRLAKQYPGKVWLVYYNERQKEFIKWKKDIEKKERWIVVHKMESLDAMADRFTSHNVILPRLSQPVDVLIRHLCNWAKDKEEDSHGVVRWVYKKLGADHLTMASNYAMLGIDRLSTGSLAEPDPKDIPAKRKPIAAGILEEEF
ncbi:MAG: phage terminase large subunit family protein [Candidatus Peribacteraceae bacterium]|nr:phage terminase large subunit family protein [Candidatus Peribacteraceae bacterium]